MRSFGLNLLVPILLCGLIAGFCLAQESAKENESLASGVRLLKEGNCRAAASVFRDELARNSRSVDARLLLGIAFDCSGTRPPVTRLFREIWNYDLDPQEQTADIRALQSEFQAGWIPPSQTAEGVYLTAVLLYRTGEYERALALLNSAGLPVARSWSYYNLLGSIYLRQARFTDAEKTLATARLQDGNRADTFYKLGTVELAMDRSSESIRYLRQALRLRPVFPAANAALGIALLQMGDAHAALNSLKKGSSIGPEIYVYLGEAYERLGNSAGAIDAYKNAIAGNPEMFPAQLSLGRLLLTQGEAIKAMECLERATRIEPHHPQAQLYLAMALLMLGRSDSAKVAALRANDLGQTQNAVFHDALGTLFKSLGDLEEAQRNFARAVQLDGTKEEYFRHLAAIQVLNSEENAMATLRAGLAEIPKSAQLHYLLSLMLLNHGSSAEGVDEARKAVQLEPSSPEYLQNLGVCLATVEKDREALEIFRRVLALNRSSAPAWLQIGILQQKAGAMEEAEKSFKQAMTADPKYAPAYFRLGKIYYDRNDDAGALPLLERARELDADWEDTYFLLGMLYRKKGDPEKANAMLALFREKKNELQNTRRKTYEKANSALDRLQPKKH
jgi:tetratricopeptide (TPR) repeat protein